MGESTPRPWLNIHGRVISDVMPRDGSHDVCSMTVTNNNRISAEANAALIVKAVNSHEALVKALEEIANMVDEESENEMLDIATRIARAALAALKVTT